MSPISLTVTGSEWPGDRAKVTQLCPVPVCYVTNARSRAPRGVCPPYPTCPWQPSVGTPGPGQMPAHSLTTVPCSSPPPSTLETLSFSGGHQA